ncbi:MAG: hypothetical protein ABIA76_01580, partial [Candidatus Diapherotrites archaeon]
HSQKTKEDSAGKYNKEKTTPFTQPTFSQQYGTTSFGWANPTNSVPQPVAKLSLNITLNFYNSLIKKVNENAETRKT